MTMPPSGGRPIPVRPSSRKNRRCRRPSTRWPAPPVGNRWRTTGKKGSICSVNTEFSMDNESLEQVKANVHRILLSQLDLEKLSAAANGPAKQAVASLIQDIVTKERLLLNANEKDKIQSDPLDEVFGFGPLEPLLKDATISDILINRRDLIYIERS